MGPDTPPEDNDILKVLGQTRMEPDALITVLSKGHEMANVIEALQRALERGKIALDTEGMVVAAVELVHA